MRQIAPKVAGLPWRTAVFYAVLIAGAFCFYATFWAKAPFMEADSASYLLAAQSLSDLHIDNVQIRGPGYPLLLVVTGSAESPTRSLFFVSLLLHFVCIWLLAVILHQAQLNEIMLTAFGLVLVLPPYIESAAYVLSENLAEAALVTAFTTMALSILHKRPGWMIISSFFIGYAGLTRPTYQVLAIATAGYMIVAKLLFDRWMPLNWTVIVRATATLICGSIVLVGGYAFINYRSFGYFGVTPRLGLTLTTRTWRFIERLPDEYGSTRRILMTARNEQLTQEGSDHDGSMSVWAAVPELMKTTGLNYLQLSDYMLKVNSLLIEKAPLSYLREVVWSFGSYWFPSSTSLANFNSRTLQFVWAALQFFINLGFAFTLMVIFGAALYKRSFEQFLTRAANEFVSEFMSIRSQVLIYGLAGTIVFYTAVISCSIEVGNPRYRVPTDSLIVFMLLLGTQLCCRLSSRTKTVCETR